ncbi:nucleoside-diphosphate kinase [Salinibacter sp. 10B]|uniref:nucleoside-diphosphate kinase n=1 Tax=Salinibacter sp. 10B TaxID=1923971 RepID=UPI000CF392FA|nr:nucleoside-diphosphate kinase [Salinibacter sp. 10B]PQJ33650.1 nucleoside-diphosphate kinase [Salinibacter sp. 10B]
MAVERTLAILKPDCVRKELVGEVLSRIQDAGFQLRALKMITMSKAEAEGFYSVHEDKPFFDDLTDFMSSGPCIPVVLEKENAIEDFRALIGATDPEEATDGTIRSDFAGSIEQNIVHGSDSPENGKKETAYFFAEHEIVANKSSME